MKNFLLFISLLAVSNMVNAQWSSDSLQNTVVKDANGTQEVTPLQATTGDGFTYVSWFETSGSSYVLKMQLFDAQGNKQWASDGLLISDQPQNSALFVYDLKTDHDGNAIVAFQDEREGFLTPVVYKISQSGSFLWGADGIVLQVAGSSFQLAPAIGVLGNDDAIIAWNASTNTNMKWVPYVKISADGVVSSDIQKIQSSNFNVSRPQFLPTEDGDVTLVFIKEKGVFPVLTSTIFARKLDDDANKVWDKDAAVSAKSISFVEYPLLANDGKNGILVSFNSSDPDNVFLNDAYVQHLRQDGSSVWGKNGVEVSVYANHNRERDGLVYDESSKKTWVLLQVLDENQFSSGVYIQSLDQKGKRLLTDQGTQLVPLSSTNYALPYGLDNTGDGLILVYTVGGVVTQKLYGMKVNYNGQQQWKTTMSAVNSNKYDLTLGDFKNNQLVAVWYDERIDGGIYAQNITNSGALGGSARMANSSSALSVRVYPTVSSGNFFVSSQNPGSIFSLYAENGSLVFQTTLNEEMNTISVPDLAAGFYVYQVNNGKGSAIGKIEISR